VKGRRDQLLYTALGYIALEGIIVVVAVILGEILSWMPTRHVSEDAFAKGFGLMVCIPALFGWVVKQEPRPRRDRILWITVAALFRRPSRVLRHIPPNV
jgi:hypothetical protein